MYRSLKNNQTLNSNFTTKKNPKQSKKSHAEALEVMLYCWQYKEQTHYPDLYGVHSSLTSVDAMSSRPFSRANHNGGSPLSFTTDMSAPLVQMASTTSGS